MSDYREYFGGRWHYYYPGVVAECTPGEQSNYRWDDRDNNNSRAKARLRTGSAGPWWDTWGY